MNKRKFVSVNVMVVLFVLMSLFTPGQSSAVSAGTYDPPDTNVESFEAYLNQSRVVVEWKTTASRGKGIGFNLYRKNDLTGEFFQINDDILPIPPQSNRGGAYYYSDENAAPGQTYTYKLQMISVKGAEFFYGPFTVTADKEIILSNPQLLSSGYGVDLRGIPAEEKSRIEAAREAKKEAKKRSKQRKSAGKAKIAVAENGLYYLSHSEIGALLGENFKNIQKKIKKSQLLLTHGGEKVAYLPARDASGIYFYAEAIDSIYTNENVYWLTTGDGLQMETIAGNRPVPNNGAETFEDVLHLEKDLMDITGLITDPEADYWMWEQIYAGYSGWDTKSFSTDAPGAALTGSAGLKFHLVGKSNTNHRIVVHINGNYIGEGQWSGVAPSTVELNFDQSYLKEKGNVIKVKGVPGTGPRSVFFIDSFDVSYQRHYRAVENKLFARGGANRSVTVEDFESSDIYVFDLTDPLKPKFITTTTVDQVGASNYRVSFPSASPGSFYMALTLDALSQPKQVIIDKASDLRKAKNGADYLVITTAELAEPAQALADYRQSRGLKTLVVDLEDIIDEFNHGITSPHAIRDFLSYVYYNWKLRPRYVVLTGKGTYDYKNYTGFAVNVIPPLMVNTLYGLNASDGRFADVEGDDGVPEMIIGRLPVVTPEELTNSLDKIRSYESSAGDWTNRVLMAADNPDPAAGNFPATSDDVAAIVTPDYSVQKVYLSQYTAATARSLIREGFNSGALLFNYIGHGFIDHLAHENILSIGDVPYLINSGKLTVMVAMTCSAGQFAVPGSDSLSERLLLSTEGGAVAVWAPTGLSLNEEAKILNEAFFRSVFESGEKNLGEAVLTSLESYKALGSYRFMADIYNILGDPALTMQ